jgi:hypothetical protein
VNFVQKSVLFFCEVHLDYIDRDIEGELAKSPKMVSNVQQLMFIGEILFTLFLQDAVLRIHDILVRIRIRGSMPLTSGSGSCYSRH